jgi:hypothetical protein
MEDLSEKQIINYFSRSYKSVDGLWFMKVEKEFGFDVALKLDKEVWSVMAKIQARLVKSFLNLESGPNALFEGIVKKLDLEGFKFETEKDANSFRIIIQDCPWYNLMIKNEREYLAELIGKTICPTEYQVWVSELAGSMKFNLILLRCCNSKNCILEFTQ